MRKDIATKTNRAERLPFNRGSGFSSPWMDELFEPLRLFDEFFGRDLLPYDRDRRFLAPAIDIDETANEYIVTADLPGLKKEDISIEASGNQLTLSAERKFDSGEDKKSERRERYYGSYQRSFTLPAGADAEKIEASYEDGVLKVHIPKGEQAKARKIEIASAKKEAASISGKH
ncbi:MAG: Hsp20/alpha crystallin family protein [Pseudobdellovibrionaceae bacterium]